MSDTAPGRPAPADAPPADAPPATMVTWKPAGPYIIEGPVLIRDNNGDPLTPPPAKIPGQIKLCGCGQSRTKPFCDGSHRR